MGQESEELRADIEQRRESMSDTIDALKTGSCPAASSSGGASRSRVDGRTA